MFQLLGCDYCGVELSMQWTGSAWFSRPFFCVTFLPLLRHQDFAHVSSGCANAYNGYDIFCNSL